MRPPNIQVKLLKAQRQAVPKFRPKLQLGTYESNYQYNLERNKDRFYQMIIFITTKCGSTNKHGFRYSYESLWYQ